MVIPGARLPSTMNTTDRFVRFAGKGRCRASLISANYGVQFRILPLRHGKAKAAPKPFQIATELGHDFVLTANLTKRSVMFIVDGRHASRDQTYSSSPPSRSRAGALTPSVLRNLRMLTLKTSSFIVASMLRLAASALWRISRPAGLQVDRPAAARLKFKKVGATTIARG